MVTTLTRPAISSQEQQQILGELRSPGMKTADEVASALGLDAEAVTRFLKDQARAGYIDSRYGRFSTWE